jgi:hypothetical protein
MKDFFDKVNGLTANLDLSSVQGYLDKVAVDVKEAGKTSKKAFAFAAEKSVSFMNETMDSEQVTLLINNAKSAVDSGVNGIKDQIEHIQSSKDTNVDSSSTKDRSTDELYEAIKTLEKKDKVGVVGEGLTTAVGAVAGIGAAGSIASAAGATTILGSSSLASALGGIFVASTPVGWVVGSAVVAGAAGYGIAKLVRSGSKQDQVLDELVKRFKQRLELLNQDKVKDSEVNELNNLLSAVIEKGLISETQADRMIMLIEEGKLEVSSALNRIKALASSNYMNDL